MALIVATTTTVSSGSAFSFAHNGDLLYVPAGISLYATDGVSPAVNAVAFSDFVENHGTILGSGGVRIQTGAAKSGLYNGPDGTISAYGGVVAVGIVTSNQSSGGGGSIQNFGLISAPQGTGIDPVGLDYIWNSGTIAGGLNGIFHNDVFAADTFSLTNAESGQIAGGYNGSLTTGQETIANYGLITGGVTLGSGANDSLTNLASGSIISGGVTFLDGNNDRLQNFGGIIGPVALGNGNNDAVLNWGTIGSITMGSGAGDYLGNAGRINGNVQLGNGAGQVFDSTNGTIYNLNAAGGQGTISAGSAGATIVGALNGGALIGGAGNDVLIANQTTQAAFSYHALATLDGKGGSNAFYGGGGTNVFLSGDATYNQVWGGKSAFDNGGTGYESNTLDYSAVAAGKSIYVDLLAGHDAYLISNGQYIYEDSIVHVPNVLGSSGADIIQCDTNTDRIDGRAGGDALYAGGGANRGSDTFVYTQYSDSNLVTGYDSIVGFQSGLDRIDVSALHLTPAQAQISTGAGSTALYLEQTAGVFNPATDLAISFTQQNALTTSDIIF